MLIASPLILAGTFDLVLVFLVESVKMLIASPLILAGNI